MTSISPKTADKFKIICKIHEMPFCHCESVTIDILLPPFKYLTQIAHILMNEASVTLCLSVSLRAFYSKYFRNSSKMIVRCESVTLVEWTYYRRVQIWTLSNEHACTSSITANVTSGGNSDPSARNWAQLILLAAIFTSESYFKPNDCYQDCWIADNPYLSVLQSSNNE